MATLASGRCHTKVCPHPNALDRKLPAPWGSEPPSAALPARWRLGQRWKNTLLYGLIRAAAGVWQTIPQAGVPLLARGLGFLAGLCARRERQIALSQLEAAYPNWPRQHYQTIVNAMFVHMAQSALELGQIGRLVDGPHAITLTAEQRALLDAAFAEGRGVIGITGHLGNWELLAQVLARAGYPVASIAKPLYDPRLTRWIHRLRTARGLGIIWRGTPKSSQDTLRIVRRNGMLAFLIDQDTDVEGVFVPFFGRLAHTPSAAARMALRLRAPVIVAWLTRTTAMKYVVHVERLAYLSSDNRQADVERLTAQMTTRLEHAIRAQPAQWVWLHQRWRRQPFDLT